MAFLIHRARQLLARWAVWALMASVPVRQGKVFDVELDGSDKAGAETKLKAMCEQLLANTVMVEDYSVELL